MRKIFVNHISDKELLYGICEKVVILNNKGTGNSTINGQRL